VCVHCFYVGLPRDTVTYLDVVEFTWAVFSLAVLVVALPPPPPPGSRRRSRSLYREDVAVAHLRDGVQEDRAGEIKTLDGASTENMPNIF